MTYGYIRDQSLRLVMQYSMAGSVIPGSYNSQQDYVNMIPGLIDDAMMTITTKYRPIVAEATLDPDGAEVRGNYLAYRMPDDYYELCARGILRYTDKNLELCGNYRFVGDRTLLVPRSLTGMLVVQYFRYPRQLGKDPDEQTELDNYPDVQTAIPYFVAANLVRQEDAFAYQTLMAQFNEKLSVLPRRPQTDIAETKDLYFEVEE